jgi:hypothetical protein
LFSRGIGHKDGVAKLGYWLTVLLLALMTFVSFRFTVMHGWTALGVFGLVATLVCFALLLSFGLSMRGRDRRSPPIAR